MKKNNKKYLVRYGGALCDKRERDAIVRSVDLSIRSGHWQAGPEAKKMEAEASKFLGVKHGVLTTSGSCACLLALSALELPEGSEVIISTVTFPTVFNSILQCGLIPVVVDAKVGTYTFDIDEVERAITPQTRAIIAIHPVGNPVDMPQLMRMVKRKEKERAIDYDLGGSFTSKKEKIYVIEDNCDGWGSTIRNKKVGSFGDVSITSFHAAHIVSMGVGGGCFTNDKEIAQRIRMYRDWGRQMDTTNKGKHKTLPKDYDPRFIYEKIGYNFQILELQAAMGRVQLRKAKSIMKARKKNFDYLTKRLSRFSNLILPSPIEDADVCWFALPLTLLTLGEGERGELINYLEKAGIETRSMFAGDITKHPAYKHTKYKIGPDGLSESQIILHDSFWISVHPRNTKKDNDYIIKTFDDFFKNIHS